MKKIDHIAIIISSETNLDFYRKLGFTESKRIVRANDLVVFLKSDEITLEVFIDPRHPARQNPETMGLRHLAFSVESFDELRRNGIEIPQDAIHKDWFGRNSVMIKDPDGQIVEVVEG